MINKWIKYHFNKKKTTTNKTNKIMIMINSDSKVVIPYLFIYLLICVYISQNIHR